jgi:hypothetical protein
LLLIVATSSNTVYLVPQKRKIYIIFSLEISFFIIFCQKKTRGEKRPRLWQDDKMSFLAEYFAEHQNDWNGDEADEKTICKGSAVKEQWDD